MRGDELLEHAAVREAQDLQPFTFGACREASDGIAKRRPILELRHEGVDDAVHSAALQRLGGEAEHLQELRVVQEDRGSDAHDQNAIVRRLERPLEAGDCFLKIVRRLNHAQTHNVMAGVRDADVPTGPFPTRRSGPSRTCRTIPARRSL